METATYFDEKVEVAEVIIAASWGIATHDVLPVDLCRDRNVLPNGQAKDILRVRQGKPVAKRPQRSFDG